MFKIGRTFQLMLALLYYFVMVKHNVEPSSNTVECLLELLLEEWGQVFSHLQSFNSDTNTGNTLGFLTRHSVLGNC